MVYRWCPSGEPAHSDEMMEKALPNTCPPAHHRFLPLNYQKALLKAQPTSLHPSHNKFSASFPLSVLGNGLGFAEVLISFRASAR